MNSAGTMVWIHCWKCKVMIVIMIMIAIIRPIWCDNVMMIKNLEILHLLRLNPEVKKILTREPKNVCLLHCRNWPTAFLAQLLIYTTGYIYVCVLISIFVFCYGREKCHIHIVWYVAQSRELVITTSKISASRLKRCRGHEVLYTIILLGWTLWQYCRTIS